MSATRTKNIPTDQIVALQTFAHSNGFRWRSRLAKAWANGQDAREPMGDALRRFRNTFGPAALADFGDVFALAPTFSTISDIGTVQAAGWSLAEASRYCGVDPEILIEQTKDGKVCEGPDSWRFARDEAGFPSIEAEDDPIHTADD